MGDPPGHGTAEPEPGEDESGETQPDHNEPDEADPDPERRSPFKPTRLRALQTILDRIAAGTFDASAVGLGLDIRELYEGLAATMRWLGRYHLSGAGLHQADLAGANLREADLRGTDLREADLFEADLRRADLRGADLRGADLRLANLTWARLSEADLGAANLREADLRMAELNRAILRGADLRLAELGGANFIGTDLTEARLDDDFDIATVEFDESTRWRAAPTVRLRVTPRGDFYADDDERAEEDVRELQRAILELPEGPDARIAQGETGGLTDLIITFASGGPIIAITKVFTDWLRKHPEDRQIALQFEVSERDARTRGGTLLLNDTNVERALTNVGHLLGDLVEAHSLGDLLQARDLLAAHGDR